MLDVVNRAHQWGVRFQRLVPAPRQLWRDDSVTMHGPGLVKASGNHLQRGWLNSEGAGDGGAPSSKMFSQFRVTAVGQAFPS